MTISTPHLTDETLFARLDGRLDPVEAAAAETHLAVCTACAAKAESFLTLFSDLAALPDPPPPQDLRPPVMAAVREMAARSAPPRLPSAIRLAAAFQLAAALAILLLVSPHLAEIARTALAAQDPAAWLDGFVRPLSDLRTHAAGWVSAFETWLFNIPLPALVSPRINPDALLPALTALLPLIGTSGLLWLLGNALLFRNPRRTHGEH
jgi:hypothetical protein